MTNWKLTHELLAGKIRDSGAGQLWITKNSWT